MSLLSINVFKISALLLLFGISIFTLAGEVKKVLFANKKKLFLHFLVMIICFFIGGLLTLKSFKFESLVVNNIIVQGWFLITGVTHLFLGSKFFNWDENNKSLPFLIFTLIVALIGSVVFLFSSKYFGLDGLHFFFWTGIILFILPFVFVTLLDSVFNIPTAIYDRWFYPDKRKMASPDKEELRNPVLLSLELVKIPGGPTSRIKVKAPENMTFSRFFYHFINDYNLHNPESPIAVCDSSGKNFSWGFYTKTGLFRTWQSIRTANTILHNRLKENQVVVCECFFDEE